MLANKNTRGGTEYYDITEGIGDEDDGGLGPGGAGDVGLLPAEVVNNHSSAGRLQRRRVLKAVRACHGLLHSSFFSFVCGCFLGTMGYI